MFKKILKTSIVLILLIILFWANEQWRMYQRFSDPNTIIGCNPEWCDTWLCPDNRNCQGCNESGGF